jgi:hypothetical protein
MHLMLMVIFLFVVLGLQAHRLGAREQIGVIFLATTMTALYLFLPNRFM